MFDFQKMMKKAQQMQNEMQKIQDELESIEVVGTAGGGKVVVKSTGKFVFKEITIDPSVMDDKEALEDLMLVALKDVNEKISEITKEKMESITSGLNIPGLKLPF